MTAIPAMPADLLAQNIASRLNLEVSAMDRAEEKEYALVRDKIDIFLNDVSVSLNILIRSLADMIIEACPERQQQFAPLLYSEFCDDEIEHPIETAIKVSDIIFKNIEILRDINPSMKYEENDSAAVILYSNVTREISKVIYESKIMLKDLPIEDLSNKRLNAYAKAKLKKILDEKNKYEEEHNKQLCDFVKRIIGANISDECIDGLDGEIDDDWLDSFAQAYVDGDKRLISRDATQIVSILKDKASDLENFHEKIGEVDIRDSSDEFFGPDFTERFLGVEENDTEND